MSENNITLVGNTVHGVSLKFLNSGKAAAHVSVAVNRRWRGKDNEWQEETSYFDVVAYGTLAQNMEVSLSKGTRVIVTGRMKQRSWETQDGQKRTALELVADEVAPALSFATAVVTKAPRQNSVRDEAEFAW
jgi:single-strand DNA-binding protein